MKHLVILMIDNRFSRTYTKAMIVILGKKGKLATSFCRHIKVKPTFLGKDIAPFESPAKVIEQLNALKPTVVINCAQYSEVEKADSEKEKCQYMIHTTPAQMAKWCAQNDSLFIHFSSPLVFDGSGSDFRSENDKQNPLSFLGQTYQQAEQAILKSGAKHFIFRTHWLYASVGCHFIKKVLDQGKLEGQLKAINDEIGSPTSCDDVAKSVVKILEKIQGLPEIPSGVYHMTGFGETNQHEWCEEILSQGTSLGFPLQVRQVKAVKFKDLYPSGTQLSNGRLSNQKILKAFGIQLPDWKSAMLKTLQEMKKNH